MDLIVLCIIKYLDPICQDTTDFTTQTNGSNHKFIINYSKSLDIAYLNVKSDQIKEFPKVVNI